MGDMGRLDARNVAADDGAGAAGSPVEDALHAGAEIAAPLGDGADAVWPREGHRRIGRGGDERGPARIAAQVPQRALKRRAVEA